MKQYVENRLKKERIIEARTNSVKGMLKDHEIYRAHGEAEHKVEAMRRQREHSELKREVMVEHAHVKE